MKAGEWLYLCVAHGNDGAMEQCCAIDYILHTLDSATALLNSPRAFPSRLQIPQTSHRHFSSLARRLGRIFAHAYFHHREAFEQAEAESSLYARFLALTYKFHLVPAEFLVIPSSAVGFGEEEFGRHELEEPIGHGPGLEERERGQQGLGQGQGQAQQVLLRPSHTRDQTVGPHGGRKSKSPPLLDISPRRVGRNRTDTMVHSDARDCGDLANRFNAELEQEELELGGSKTARPGEEFGRGEEVEKVDDVVIVKEQQEEEGRLRKL
ncbi:Mob1/phocein, partial [Cyathus striatus]